MERVLDHRMARQLLTVIDTLGMNAEQRAALAAAGQGGRACRRFVVAFDTPADVCRSRNQEPVRSGARPGARVTASPLAQGARQHRG